MHKYRGIRYHITKEGSSLGSNFCVNYYIAGKSFNEENYIKSVAKAKVFSAIDTYWLRCKFYPQAYIDCAEELRYYFIDLGACKVSHKVILGILKRYFKS